MGNRDLNDLHFHNFPEYIRAIHKLSWEEFVAEVLLGEGTGYVSELYKRAVESGAKTILELGVLQGESTRALLKAATENKGHLYSVELGCPSLQRTGEALQAGGADLSFWTPICGDDLEVAKQWAIPIDFLFIDTSHTYEHTLRELEAYSKFVVQEGIIVLHDIKPESKAPVKLAIDSWLKLHNEWVFEDISPPKDWCGLGLLKRK